MNDLSKKEEMHIEEKTTSTVNLLLQKKLENYLLLLYQGYLKGETNIDSEIHSAFLSLVKQDAEIAFKVRMLQLDYLKLENVELEGEWDEATEELFPKVEVDEKLLEEGRQKTLSDYKETILEILNSSSELGS